MVRIRLLTSCLADPSGIKFRGHEVEVSEEKAEIMVASRQWEIVSAPPAKEAPAVAEAAETGDWTPDPPPAKPKPKREYRKRS
jgi:hypothetical protein